MGGSFGCKLELDAALEFCSRVAECVVYRFGEGQGEGFIEAGHFDLGGEEFWHGGVAPGGGLWFALQ